jgi:hypothetical protein
MSKPRPITEQELRDIEDSVTVAHARLIEHATLCRKLQKVLRRKKNQTEGANLAERALLWLQVGQNRDLREVSYASVINAAAQRNDHRFFIRLGKILTQKPYTLDSAMENTRKVEWFLLSHWATKRDGLPELFYLTADALVKACKQSLNLSFTKDKITKTRQRLGLKSFLRQKREAVFVGGRWTFPPVDKRPPS